MALAMTGIVLFSIGGCLLIGARNHGVGAIVLVIGLIIGVIGMTANPGDGSCNADGYCDHTHGVPYSP